MARRRSNQAKWMREPRNVNWTIAEVAYEATDLQRKYFYGDLRNPREITQEKLRNLRRRSKMTLDEVYREILARGQRGE